ncbi:MAG: histidine kinase dimerization/phospho-acceptor domain-containing protein [Thermomicrobiales bacterium]
MPARPPPNQIDHSRAIPVEMLAQTQHELRTPLAAILGHAQLLQRRLGRLNHLTAKERAAVERSTSAIEAGCRNLAAAIDHLDPTDPQWSAGLVERSDGARE